MSGPLPCSSSLVRPFTILQSEVVRIRVRDFMTEKSFKGKTGSGDSNFKTVDGEE